MSIRLNAAATPMSIRLKANGGTASLRLAQGRTGPAGPKGDQGEPGPALPQAQLDALDGKYAGKAKVDNGGQVLTPVRVPTLVVDKTLPDRENDYDLLWAEGDTLYSLARDATLQKSTDAGLTWTKRGFDYNIGGLGGAFWKTTTSGALLVFASGSPGKVYRSTDDGATWGLVLTMQTTAKPLGPTSWVEDPATGYLYLGEYQTDDTLAAINVYRSTDEGATWSVFHAFPGPATADPNRIRHIHAIQYDPVDGRVVVMTGDSDPAAGIYRTNAAGDALEPWVTNGDVSLPDSSEGGRAIGFLPFADYIAWTGDATSNPYLMRAPRSNPSAAERVYRLNSTGWFAIKASADGSRWLISSSSEDATKALDANIHLYAVEDQGATIYEVATVAPKVEHATTAVAPVGRVDNITGETFWLRAHNAGFRGSWRCRLARGAGAPLPQPGNSPVAYSWVTLNSPGSVSVPAGGSVVIGRDRAPSIMRQLVIRNSGVMQDTDTSFNLHIQVRKKSDGTVLYDSIQHNAARTNRTEASGPVASVTLTSNEIVEFVIYNGSGAAVNGTGHITYGFGQVAPWGG